MRLVHDFKMKIRVRTVSHVFLIEFVSRSLIHCFNPIYTDRFDSDRFHGSPDFLSSPSSLTNSGEPICNLEEYWGQNKSDQILREGLPLALYSSTLRFPLPHRLQAVNRKQQKEKKGFHWLPPTSLPLSPQFSLSPRSSMADNTVFDSRNCQISKGIYSHSPVHCSSAASVLRL